MMYILGVYYGHNASVCLLKNGKVIAAASEERFNGIKNYTGFPKQAIAYVLKEANISGKDVTLVTLSHLYRPPIHSLDDADKKSSILQFLKYIYYPIHITRVLWGKLAFAYPSLIPIGHFFYVLAAKTGGAYIHQKEVSFLASYLQVEKNTIRSFDHHLSHAASAYYASPFNTQKVLVVTIDGEGDNYSASVSVFHKRKYTVLSKTHRESSLGLLYAYLTQFLGMKPNEHEYKIMGLAPYAKEEHVEKLYKRIQHIIAVDKKKLVFTSAFNTVDTELFLSKECKHIRFDTLSGAFQKLVEEKVVELIEAAIKKTNIHTIALAGGVFMNVKVNKKIAESKLVEQVFVLPSCGDETSILGSSYLGYVEQCQKEKKPLLVPPIEDIYWGPEFSNKEIETVLKKEGSFKKHTVKKIPAIEKEVAILLSQGNVVARVCGRMEFGARALGNRSILADPRNPDTVRLINEFVKNRDFWMPFAPSLLDKKATEYFANPKNIEAYYMIQSFDTTEKGKKDLKAAMHPYDFTIRPQVVTKAYNPSYYKLIEEFAKLTGVASVLNTSFNLHGYPVVLGPKEAIYAFEHSGLEYLAMGEYLVKKKHGKN